MQEKIETYICLKLSRVRIEVNSRVHTIVALNAFILVTHDIKSMPTLHVVS